MGAALVLHKEADRGLDEWLAAVGDMALRGGAASLASWEAMPAMTGVPRTALPKLYVRCAAVVCHLTSARAWRIEAMLANSFRRIDLVHHFEFVQYDETPLPTRLTSDPAAPRELASFRNAPQLALERVATSDAICRVSAIGSLSVQ